METTENSHLDPATRRRIYLEAAEAFETGASLTESGFCLWYNHTKDNRSMKIYRSIKTMFPEYTQMAGNGIYGLHWSANNKQRAEALRKAAQMIQL